MHGPSCESVEPVCDSGVAARCGVMQVDVVSGARSKKVVEVLWRYSPRPLDNGVDGRLCWVLERQSIGIAIEDQRRDAKFATPGRRSADVRELSPCHGALDLFVKIEETAEPTLLDLEHLKARGWQRGQIVLVD